MRKGVLLSLAVAVVSGCSIFANGIFVTKINPLIFTVVRNAAVAVVMTGILLATGKWRSLTGLSKKDLIKLVFIGVIGGGIPFALFFTGLSMIGALNANIIQKSLFMWVALLAVPLLHERLSAIQVVGYVVLFVGMFITGGTFHIAGNSGALLVLAATLLWAVENVLAKRTLSAVDPSVVSWGRMVFGLPFLLAAAAATGKLGLLASVPTGAAVPVAVSSGFLIVYMVTWYSALKAAPATLVSSVLVFAPVVTAILTGFVSLRVPVGQQAVNLIIISVGTILVIIERLFPKRNTSAI